MRSLEEVRARLARYARTAIPGAALMRQAAVAAILRERSAGLELLLIRRAEHPKDPWSGHMAFPGGRVDADDASAYAAALRETREELALDLELHGRPIGELSHQMAAAHGKPLPMVIHPFVFELAGEPILAQNDEVQEVVWVSLAFLLDASNRTEMDYTFAGQRVKLPCYPIGDRVLWGLTLRMIDELIEVLTGP
ncbi:CoA pyrophosphatase [Myxococcota bacterium]|nr:CoA pyrophosphatase [Myxococcota bacterium]